MSFAQAVVGVKELPERSGRQALRSEAEAVDLDRLSLIIEKPPSKNCRSEAEGRLFGAAGGSP